MYRDYTPRECVPTTHALLLLCWNVVKIWKLSAKSASIVHNGWYNYASQPHFFVIVYTRPLPPFTCLYDLRLSSCTYAVTATDIKTVVITVHDDARHTVANRIGRIEASKTECSKTECSQTECSKTGVLIARILLTSLLGDITVQVGVQCIVCMCVCVCVCTMVVGLELVDQYLYITRELCACLLCRFSRPKPDRRLLGGDYGCRHDCVTHTKGQ